MRTLSPTEISRFKKLIWNHYKKHGRKMPWRGESDPYQILVSEVMLQQTQVSRVIPKYKEFIKAFPNFKKLSEAKLGSVLAVWSGLGYNRRAKFLWQLAKVVVSDYKAKLPKEVSELQKLPGIGKGTAGSIAAFAFNLPVIFIETNIRRVFIHSFFINKKVVYDTELIPLIEQTLETKNPREWYWALMDYGTYLKEITANPNTKSAHYVRQSKFKGSKREVRGAIIRFFTTTKSVPHNVLIKHFANFENEKIHASISELSKEGFLVLKGGIISIN